MQIADSTSDGVFAETVADIISVRRAHPSWGPKKIHAVLRRTRASDVMPTERTIARVLERTGFIVLRKRLAHQGTANRPKPTFTVTTCNDLWTVDFKGWWTTQDKSRCEPLTVRDSFSRFVLATHVLTSTKMAPVRDIFAQLFLRYGLPKAILSDNGAPFAFNRGFVRLTKLSAWWLALGIEHVLSRPGKPSDNGAHERMHRDIADELEAFAALDLPKQQAGCDRWRHDFNHHRPHEALEMKTPASVFRKSLRTYVDVPIEIVYPEDFFVLPIRKTGTLRFKGHEVFITTALHGYRVGLQFVSPKRFAVWFAQRNLGFIDFNHRPVVLTEGDTEPQTEVAPLSHSASHHNDSKQMVAFDTDETDDDSAAPV